LIFLDLLSLLTYTEPGIGTFPDESITTAVPAVPAGAGPEEENGLMVHQRDASDGFQIGAPPLSSGKDRLESRLGGISDFK